MELPQSPESTKSVKEKVDDERIRLLESLEEYKSEYMKARRKTISDVTPDTLMEIQLAIRAGTGPEIEESDQNSLVKYAEREGYLVDNHISSEEHYDSTTILAAQALLKRDQITQEEYRDLLDDMGYDYDIQTGRRRKRG